MKKLILILLFVPIISFGQTQVNKKIYKKANVNVRNYDFKSPVSVSMRTSKQADGNKIFGDGTDSGALGELENALFNQGFDVVSESTAREYAQISIDKNRKNISKWVIVFLVRPNYVVWHCYIPLHII